LNYPLDRRHSYFICQYIAEMLCPVPFYDSSFAQSSRTSSLKSSFAVYASPYNILFPEKKHYNEYTGWLS
jgi:hypothetical protein